MTEAPDRRPGSWNRASLVIHSDKLTPDEISEALGAKPADSAIKGEPIGPRTPKPRTTSFWAIDAPLADDVRIEEQIGSLLDFVDEHSDALARLMSSEGAHLRIQAAISDENGQYPMTFDASMLQRLAKVPLTLWLTAWMHFSPDRDV
jgi:hypothetical protein